MPIPFKQFRTRVIAAVKRKKSRQIEARNIDRKIALGVLLWAIGAVAEADGEFRPEENKKVKEVLRSYLKISEDDYPVVLMAIRQAAIEKINFYQFADEIGKLLSQETKVSIIEDLCRVACADRELAESELAVIKKVSLILGMAADDFSKTVAKIQKEYSCKNT